MKCCKKKPKDPPKNPDEEFKDHMRKANSLLFTLRRPKDKEIAQEMIKNAQTLYKVATPEVKLNINEFLTYFMKVLHRNCETQPLEIYEEWYTNNKICRASTATMWLREQVAYFAMSQIPTGSIIFYLAVAADPAEGWVTGGLRNASF